jgi:hypothetical protein
MHGLHSRHALAVAAGTCAALLVLLVVAGAQMALAQGRGDVDDVGPPQDFLAASDVVAAFSAAGLNVQSVTPEPVGGNPAPRPVPNSKRSRLSSILPRAVVSTIRSPAESWFSRARMA